MKRNIFKSILLALVVSVTFSGCMKDALEFGQTIVLMGDDADPNAPTPNLDAFVDWVNNGGNLSEIPEGLAEATFLVNENGDPNPDAYNCHFHAWGESPEGNSAEYPEWSNTPNTKLTGQRLPVCQFLIPLKISLQVPQLHGV